MPYTTRELVSAFQTSKKTQQAFCKDKAVPLSTLQYHLQKYKKKSGSSGSALRPRFVPVIAQHSARRSPTIIIKGEFSLAELVELTKSMGA